MTDHPDMEPCPSCHGTGLAFGSAVLACPMCEGKGEVPVSDLNCPTEGQINRAPHDIAAGHCRTTSAVPPVSAARKNTVIPSAIAAEDRSVSPGRGLVMEDSDPLAALPHWKQAMALSLRGSQKAREWAIQQRMGVGL